MPKTWDDTLEGHREAVRRAAMQAALEIASEAGFQKVSMSSVATRTGITRATLYKYFPDVESIFVEWHRRTLEHHVAHVDGIVRSPGDAAARLRAILEFFAMTAFRHHGSRFAEVLHSREHAVAAENRLLGILEQVIEEGIDALEFRKDLWPREVAVFLHGSLSGVHRLPDEVAVRRVVDLAVGSIAAEAPVQR